MNLRQSKKNIERKHTTFICNVLCVICRYCILILVANAFQIGNTGKIMISFFGKS